MRHGIYAPEKPNCPDLVLACFFRGGHRTLPYRQCLANIVTMFAGPPDHPTQPGRPARDRRSIVTRQLLAYKLLLHRGGRAAHPEARCRRIWGRRRTSVNVASLCALRLRID